MAVAFARVLRGAGLRVPLGSVLTFVDALGKLRLDDRQQVYWAGRATLVRNPEDIPLYDRSFEVFWLSARGLDATEPDRVGHWVPTSRRVIDNVRRVVTTATTRSAWSWSSRARPRSAPAATTSASSGAD